MGAAFACAPARRSTPQARHDLGGIEGFDDVVVRAQAQPSSLSTSSASAVTMMTGSGFVADGAQYVQPVHARQIHVQQNRVGTQLGNSRMASTPSMAEQVRKPSRRR